MSNNETLAEAIKSLGISYQKQVDYRDVAIGELSIKLQIQGQRNDALQAKVDSLMLEYCPDEMTKEQLDEWADNQVAAGDLSDLHAN